MYLSIHQKRSSFIFHFPENKAIDKPTKQISNEKDDRERQKYVLEKSKSGQEKESIDDKPKKVMDERETSLAEDVKSTKDKKINPLKPNPKTTKSKSNKDESGET